MELFTPQFWSAFISIIIIDLVLAGDNALVIGMTARGLHKSLQLKAILWGTAGAIIVRIAATMLVVWLLKIPGLLLLGGLMLIWIAYKLLIQKRHPSQHRNTDQRLGAAISTIIIADTVMGLDNVLAIAGAAGGNIVLVIFGLLISVPIMIWGSTLIIKWIERFPLLIYVGAAVLAYTAAKMITNEPWLQRSLFTDSIIQWIVIASIIMGVIFAGILTNQRKALQEN